MVILREEMVEKRKLFAQDMLTKGKQRTPRIKTLLKKNQYSDDKLLYN